MTNFEIPGIKTNSAFDYYLKKYRILLDEVGKIRLHRKLESILKRGIVKVDRCYVFNEEKNVNLSHWEQLPEEDLTYTEEFENHLHPELLLTRKRLRKYRYLFKQGLAFCLRLQKTLPNEAEFVTIFGYNFKPPYPSFTIRFYTKREGEKALYVEDLESYTEDALMVIHSDEFRSR